MKPISEGYWTSLMREHEDKKKQAGGKEIKKFPGVYVEGSKAIHMVNALLWGFKEWQV